MRGSPQCTLFYYGGPLDGLVEYGPIRPDYVYTGECRATYAPIAEWMKGKA